MNSKALKILHLTILCSAISGVTAPAPSFPVVSDFSTDNEGWTIPVNGNPAAFSSTGGNPGGYIRYVFAGSAPSNIRAPSKFLGNWSSLDGGGTLRYDHAVFMQTGVVTTFSNAVTISGPGGRAIWMGPAAEPPESGWTNFAISIQADAWLVTSGDWASILTNVTVLDLRLEVYGNVGGVDQEGIDNVRLEAGPVVSGPKLSIRCSQMEMCWTSRVSRTYQLQYRSSLTTNSWADLGSPIQGDGSRKCLTDAVAEGQPQRFYRIVESP